MRTLDSDSPLAVEAPITVAIRRHPRRSLRPLLPVLGPLLAMACGDSSPPTPPPLPMVLTRVEQPTQYADPFVGSGGFGFRLGSAFEGAAAPHGLAKVGPDTSGPFGTVNFLHYSGYWYGDDTIQGFSHLHLHGTGATDYGVLSVMPVPSWDPRQAYRRRQPVPVPEEERVRGARLLRGDARSWPDPRRAYRHPARRASPLHL